MKRTQKCQKQSNHVYIMHRKLSLWLLKQSYTAKIIRFVQGITDIALKCANVPVEKITKNGDMKRYCCENQCHLVYLLRTSLCY